MSSASIRDGLVLMIGLIISVGVHEFGHAFVAHWLGDPTPGKQGRVTLNPMAHADPLGTLIVPAFLIFMMPGGFLFGWGKPVEVQPLLYRRRVGGKRITMSAGDILVSFAGPFMNVVMAFLMMGIITALVRGFEISVSDPMIHALRLYLVLNLGLMVFNLLPIPPLDGSHILISVLHPHGRGFTDFLQQYGMWILIAVMVTGVLRYVFEPILSLELLLFTLATGS
jgi:Zn-dependent protease